jgi:hypothetical protein
VFRSRLLQFAVVFFAVSPCTRAQETVTTASLTGRVLDPSGAAVAGALVQAIALATNRTSAMRTDLLGRYRIPYLGVGSYVVRVQQAGFSDAERPVQLTVGGAFDLMIELHLGTAKSTINVSAQPPVIEGDRSQIAQTVSEVEAASLPFNGRNYLDLALLVPGVSPTNTASVQTFAETSPVLGQGYSTSSQRNFSNSFIVDGLSANDDAAGLAGNVYGLDAVREFQVVTAGGQAEFGRALGGYFNIITKSGTNRMRGDLYGYLRNQRLNASNALSGGELPLTQGQYGASLSGPIRRDRTFFFGNFEQRRLNTDGIIAITPANAEAINARLLFVGYKAPLLAVGTGPTTLYPTTVHTTDLFLRGDHQVSQHDQMNLRYSLYTLDSVNARGAGSLASVSNGTAVRDTNHTVALSNIATISPRTFNETRGQFTYDDLEAPPNDEVGPTVTIAGVASFGRFSSSPTARLNYLYEVVDNVLMQRGAHTLKSGVDFLYNDTTITFPQSSRGAYTFASLAAFQAGTYNTQGYTQSFGISSVVQNNPNVGVYLQDEWKLNRQFTLNAGVRYDLQFLQSISTDTNNVSPRIGFAWSPYREARTVVRGSFGLFYDRVPLRALANALLSASNTTDVTQAKLLSYTFSPGQLGAPVFPNVAAAPPTGALVNFTLMDRNLPNAYSEQAGLEVEQQIGDRGSLAISYQHVRGLHLLTSVNTNINPDGTRPQPTYGNSKVYAGKADSSYDGLAVSFAERPMDWGSVRISYTWSKAIDDVGEFFFSAPINNFFVGEDRGRSDDDQRHRVVFDATLHTPTRTAHGAIERVVYGWQMGGILQYYSRLPLNLVTGATSLQGTTLRPCVGGVLTMACSQARPGSVIRRNVGTGFDFFSLNARLSRTFAITERVTMEGIAEAFNALNHRNDMVPNGTWGTGAYPQRPNATFGQATAAGDPRSVQMAVRLHF